MNKNGPVIIREDGADDQEFLTDIFIKQLMNCLQTKQSVSGFY